VGLGLGFGFEVLVVGLGLVVDVLVVGFGLGAGVVLELTEGAEVVWGAGGAGGLELGRSASGLIPLVVLGTAEVAADVSGGVAVFALATPATTRMVATAAQTPAQGREPRRHR
jgi:hypothetical protein